MLLQSLVLFGLHISELLCLIHLFVSLGNMLLETADFLSLLGEGSPHFLKAGIVLADHLLQLFRREVVHSVQIEGDLLRLSLLLHPLLVTLIADSVACHPLFTSINIIGLLFEFFVQLVLPLVKHFGCPSLIVFVMLL